MHHLLLVTKSADGFKSAEECKSSVKNELEQDSSFVNEDDGRFHGPICDWFVMGGRWSGHLQKIDGYDYYKSAMKLLGKKDGEYIHMSEIADKDNQEMFQKVWEAHGKKGLHPLIRNTYEDNGYDDDCMLVTQEIYDKLLKQYEGENVHYDEYQDPYFVDMDWEDVSPEFIGKKYICVVDYHN